jgi:hypothetical protein
MQAFDVGLWVEKARFHEASVYDELYALDGNGALGDVRREDHLLYHTSPYVRIRQHTSAYVSIHQHTGAYVSIRQHTKAYVRW